MQASIRSFWGPGVAAALGVCGSGSLASAQSWPISQERGISASVDVSGIDCFDSDSASASAPAGFEAWDGSAVADVDCAQFTVTTTQSSSMTPNEVRFTSSMHWTNVGMGLTSFEGTAESTFMYTFYVHRAIPYELSGHAYSETYGFPPQYGPELVLRGPGGVVFEWIVDVWELDFSNAGVLMPGEYTISGAYRRSHLVFDYFGENRDLVAFSFGLTMPAPACPCDWDADGRVGSPDAFAFIDDFFSGRADFNFSGATNSQDFFDFLGCFFAPPGECI